MEVVGTLWGVSSTFWVISTMNCGPDPGVGPVALLLADLLARLPLPSSAPSAELCQHCCCCFVTLFAYCIWLSISMLTAHGLAPGSCAWSWQCWPGREEAWPARRLWQRRPGREEAWPARRCPRGSAGPGERGRGLLVGVLVAALLRVSVDWNCMRLAESLEVC